MNDNSGETLDIEGKKYKYRAAAFLFGIAGLSAIIGFSRTLAMAKKKDTLYFNKGMSESHDLAGVRLAMRALGYGSLISIIGTGSLFYGIWKLSGARNFEEFRTICGSILPRIPKNDIPTSRTEFEGLNDLMTYLATWKK